MNTLESDLNKDEIKISNQTKTNRLIVIIFSFYINSRKKLLIMILNIYLTLLLRQTVLVDFNVVNYPTY